MENANPPPTRPVLLAALHVRFNQELQELQKILAFIDSRLESIERFLNRFTDQPNKTNINDPEFDDGSVETPLVSPFPHSDNDSDDEEDPETPLLVGRGSLATANAVIDCRMAKITVGEGITRSVFSVKGIDLDCHLPGEWEISRDAKLNPFKDTLVFRRMVEFLGAIPINLKCNMWESEDLIKKPINWDKPPKNGDGAWHAKIRLIDPDGEEFTKTLQSIPTTRKLSERESPREIIDLDHFYDT
ncbi:hypothetical protein Tco_0947196 [Tanacetum coccineum]